MLYYTDNYKLQKYLAAHNIEPIKESGTTNYYIKNERLKSKLYSYYCRECFYRGGKFES